MLGSEELDVSPMVVVAGTDLEAVPGVALELDARNLKTTDVIGTELEPR